MGELPSVARVNLYTVRTHPSVLHLGIGLASRVIVWALRFMAKGFLSEVVLHFGLSEETVLYKVGVSFLYVGIECTP